MLSAGSVYGYLKIVSHKYFIVKAGFERGGATTKSGFRFLNSCDSGRIINIDFCFNVKFDNYKQKIKQFLYVKKGKNRI